SRRSPRRWSISPRRPLTRPSRRPPLISRPVTICGRASRTHLVLTIKLPPYFGNQLIIIQKLTTTGRHDMKRTAHASSFVALLAGFTGMAQAGDGILTVATIGEPPTLDAMQTPTDIVLTIDQHIFETLFTYDAAWRSVPLLAAAMPEVSQDGLTYRIPLREGVTFHDGSAFDSADVVASLERWMKVNSKGKQVAEVVESLTADGDHGVVIQLK